MPFDLGSTNAVVGTSVGVSMAELGVDETELLRRADAAMYAAKTRGGTTRTAIYDPTMDESDRRRGRLSAEFEQAFERDELSLAFQPILSADDHSVVGAEALLRWRHRELGPVSTATILELAELRGLMMRLNAWIVAVALDALNTLDLGEDSGFFVAVNLSPTELESPELVTNISDALLTHGVAPNRLVLELSERLIIDQTDQRDNIAALAALGVTLSLDDFGEGRTALTHLRGIPIAQLKLDRSLIQRAETSAPDRTILDSIVSLGHDLSLEVVAEGVEHEAQIEMATLAGADLLQGVRTLPAHDPLAVDPAGGRQPGPAPGRPAPTTPFSPGPRKGRLMARPLDTIQWSAAVDEVERRQSVLNKAAARALAAATSALLVATLVITRSDQALTAEGTASSSSVASGTIAVTDDDQGQSLFDLSAMAPGRPEVQCLTILYDGSIVPVELTLRAEAAGALAPFLRVTVEAGSGGAFGSCAGFTPHSTPDGTVFDGTLHDLAGQRPVVLDHLHNTGDTRNYRITFDLEDTSDALGLSTTVDLVWEVTPS